MNGPIDAFLDELARQLSRAPGVRSRVLDEVQEHLEEAAADERAHGLSAHDAELAALNRFGSARALARELAPRRRRSLARALIVALGVGLGSGLAFAQVAGPPALVGLQPIPQRSSIRPSAGLSGLGQARLVSLDPTTLAQHGTGIRLQTGNIVYDGALPPDVALRAPDGEVLGVVNGGELQLIALRPLRGIGAIHFAPTAPSRGPRAPSQSGGSEDVVRAGAWLTGGRIALLVQHQAPPYARRITSRTLVLADPATRRLVARTRVGVRGAIVAFGSAADRLVVLSCRNATTSLFSADAAGSSWSIPLAVPCGVSGMPRLAVRSDGAKVAIVGSDALPVVVDLRSHVLHRVHPALLRGPFAPAPQPRRSLAIAWFGHSLAITGTISPGPDNYMRARGLGVALLDPSSGAVRMLTPNGAVLMVVDRTLVVSGFAHTGRGRYPGAGITAFAPDGHELWHAEGNRLVWPFATAQRVYAPRPVKRHTIVDVYDLGSGRPGASIVQRGNGIRPVTGVIDSIWS